MATQWVEFNQTNGLEAEPCGARRGPQAQTYCELPHDHVIGRNYTPSTAPNHLGRDRAGHWHSWPPGGGVAERRPRSTRQESPRPSLNRSTRLPCKQSKRCRNEQGYPVQKVGPKGRQVSFYEHRLVYEQHHGPIPGGLTIDHLCHGWDESCAGGPSCLHRRCIEITHLEAVTRRVNTLRGRSRYAINARKTHCDYGHEFSDANTYRRRDTPGRQCKTCNRVRANTSPRSLADGDSRHGTLTGYNYYRCRCDRCKARMAAYRQARKRAAVSS